MELLAGLAVILFSLTVHEFAHGRVAELCGDDTARQMGRVTLNPIPHIDPIGTLLLPGVLFFLGLPMFAWARPVPVFYDRLNHPRRDAIWVAAAGPGANLVVASVALLSIRWLPWALLDPSWQELLVWFFGFAGFLNLILAVFNLLPIPPLDGSRIISGLLPPRLSYRYDRWAPWGQWILLGLFATNLLPWILRPMVGWFASLMGMKG
ncbi:MAG TPA: site-2 protease family protein [Elusimicrobiota bacterium]|nr:site-2 protease family protein [Elusimicrobiota bacterium]